MKNNLIAREQECMRLEQCMASDRHGAEVALMKEIQDWSLKKR